MIDDLTPLVEPLSATFTEQGTTPPTPKKSRPAKTRAAAVGQTVWPEIAVEETEHHKLDTMA
jgi:hypothetical protein